MRERFPFSATKRLGLSHPDGTLTVYAPDIGIEQARREAADFDENQDNPAFFTRVVSLRVEDIDVLEVPSLKATQKTAQHGDSFRFSTGVADTAQGRNVERQR